MPPKKSGDSSTAGAAGSTGGKRKLQEAKSKPRSRSTSPLESPVAASNGASSSHENAVISFTPMNAPKGAGAARSGKARGGKGAREPGDLVDDDDEWIMGSSKTSRQKAQHPSVESPNGGASRDAEFSTQGARGPKRRKSLMKLKEPEEASSQQGDRERGGDVDMAEATAGAGAAEGDGKKKARKSGGRQLTLDFFRQENRAQPTEASAKPAKEAATPAPAAAVTAAASAGASAEGQQQTNPKVKIKFKGYGKASDTPAQTPTPTQTVPPSTFYGGASSPAARAEASPAHGGAGRGKPGKALANGTPKETLVLPTNPPSDALSENLPSPPASAEPSEAAGVDANAGSTANGSSSSSGRGRRTTRNAAPCYSGFPAATPPSVLSAPSAHASSSTTMTSTTSRHASPSAAPPTKAGKKSARSVSPQRRGRRNTEATRSVSPRRGGRTATTTSTQTPASMTPVDSSSVLDAALAKAAANDRRGRARSGRKLIDELGEMIDIEPGRQQSSYHPRAPSSYEYGMMPLGTLPPKDRVDEVFNKAVPKEPEAKSDMTSSYQFANLWGTAGNKDVTILKGNQGRAKKMFQKAQKLDASNDWIFPDTEGAVIVKVVDQEENSGRPRGKSKSQRRRLSTPLVLDTSVSPSPSFTHDHPARSTEELISPISDNVPETPQEVTTMQIDEPGFEGASKRADASVFVGDVGDLAPSEVSEVGSSIRGSMPKPQLLAIIKEAKAAAEKAGNLETLEFLTSLETSGNEHEVAEVLSQMLRHGNISHRLSPATVPGGKRTAWQREEDEGFGTADIKGHVGKKQRTVEPYAPPYRGKRPDTLDESTSHNLTRILDDSRYKITALNAKWVPERYTCLRGKPDKTASLQHAALEDRGFDSDDRAWSRDYFKYKLGPVTRDSADVDAEGEASNGRGKRRRNDREKLVALPPPTIITTTTTFSQNTDAIATNRYEEQEDEDMEDAETPDHLMDDEESPCTVCGGVGAPLVICDGPGCKEEQHYGCAIPPLTQAQVDAMPEWFCRKCSTKKQQPSRKPPESKGIWGKLFEGIDKSNPRAYELPKWIREAYTGVETGELGAYRESIDFYDLTKTKDKELNDLPFEKQLLGSDGEYWHQDCLPEPLVEPHAIKAFGEKPEDQVLLMKWKCPLHIPEDAYATRQPRQPNEGRDTVWPPKNRVPKSAPPSPDAPNPSFSTVYRNGKELLLPNEGINLSFLPNANKAKEQKALDDRVFTGQELQAIEGLRNLRMRFQAAAQAPPPPPPPPPPPVAPLTEEQVLANPVVDFILSNVPDYLRPVVESTMVGRAFERDAESQIHLINAIKESMESKLKTLNNQQL
ncbi:hypothetical protein Dda_1709 [Drechslerella dactyloides]|uniref:PHD-type domain-containing protein n=1 Tax=Drechslerella dactyloides TaxID=74499 RepID=A0AAD6J3Z1_DREDA|nr:hypothetical protein Dda_1709 [Drechslerella dactyloides]